LKTKELRDLKHNKSKRIPHKNHFNRTLTTGNTNMEIFKQHFGYAPRKNKSKNNRNLPKMKTSKQQ
jgi:hypothetical protein